MHKHSKEINKKKELLYNKVLLLCRNRLFYTKFDLIDTFQNRINLIFIHVSFIFIKINRDSIKEKNKLFCQKVFDLIFTKIELNMREIGSSDTKINNDMRFLVKSFYSILLECEKYKDMNIKLKNNFINKYLVLNKVKKTINNKDIIEYFDKYEAFCFDLSPDSVLEGELKFNYN